MRPEEAQAHVFPDGSVAIRMTKEQADMLMEVYYCAMGGQPSGPRGHMDKLFNTTRDAGLEFPIKYKKYVDDSKSLNVTFKNEMPSE